MRLFRKGEPQMIRAYDNDGKTPDRYTIVYLSPGEEQCHVSMGSTPRGPFGTLCYESRHFPVDEMGSDGTRSGKPPRHGCRHTWLGRRIRFADLPQACREIVLRDYKKIWNIA